jgi:endothelin-converting enzyme/putative endopeptidase
MLRASVIVASMVLAPVIANASTSLVPQGVHIGDLNRHAEACTDFYEYANGAWRSQNPIPEGLPRWSRRIAAHDDNWHRLQHVVEEVSRKIDWPKGSIEQQVGDHYAACMNETAVNAAGLKPLAASLADIDAARTAADVQRLVRRLHELGIFAGFSTNGEADYRDGTRFIENIAAGNLGLPDRSYYLRDEPRFAEARAKFKAHVSKTLVLGGIPEAQSNAAAGEILALEKRLAESALDSATAADLAATDHKTSFSQLKQLAPHIDWDSYFSEAKLPKTALSVSEPKNLAQLEREFRETPVAIWKAYLMWQLLDAAAPSLSQAFVEESFNFKDKYLGGAGEPKSRSQRCVESTDATLSDPLAQKYVQAYFPPSSKAKAQEVVGNLRSQLREMIAAATWMQPATKTKALDKLNATDIQVGYPDTWRDYSGVRILRDAFWQNVAAGRRFNVDDNRRQVGKPTNRDAWRLSPASPDSYIILEINTMVLTAGTLQPPFFNADASDAVNYGAMGIGVAHDLTHAIDATGAAIDVTLHPRNWWGEQDHRDFDARSQCLVDQFEEYFIEPGVHHDGKRVRDETVADLAGVRIAYLALQKSLRSHPAASADGLTPEQQFFISWGQTSGHAMRIEAQRQLLKTDPHPAPKYRVIGPFSNTPEFQQAFSCQAGSAMVRPPQQRCAVW